MEHHKDDDNDDDAVGGGDAIDVSKVMMLVPTMVPVLNVRT